MKRMIARVPATVLVFFLSATAAAPQENIIRSVSFRGGVTMGYLFKKALYERFPASSAGNADAVSGATGIGFTAGIGLGLRAGVHELETGLDLAFNRAEITYDDPARSVTGKRGLGLMSASLSASYDIGLFTRENGDPLLKTALGFFGAWYPFGTVTETGNLPIHRLCGWTFGPDIRLYWYPFETGKRTYTGFTIDLQQSFNRLYIDDYLENGLSWKVGSKTVGAVHEIIIGNR